jgi:outer membrane protein assembly factor BamD
MQKMKKLLASIAILSFLTACSGNAEPRGFGVAGDKQLYEEALAAIGNDNKAVVEKLNVLELNYPKSSALPEAMILKLYALYSSQRYEEALSQADRFIKLYPDHKSTPYAYYIKGMSNQARMMDIRRDQGPTIEALNSFNELNKLYPDSNYSNLARNKVIEAETLLAVKNLEIGKFYAQRGQFSAASERFQKVLDDFSHTTAAPEALYRMLEIHYNLNGLDLAMKYLSLLETKYPGHFWTNQAGNLLKSGKRTKRLVIPSTGPVYK